MRWLWLAVFAGLALGAQNGKPLPLAVLRDKISGGWAGQMIGVSYGAPTEFKYQARINEDPLPEWKPERVSNALNQDDLYVDMTFAKVLDEKGLNATTEDFGAMFREARYRLWHANLAARRALKRGVQPTKSGTPEYNVHANDIDFQIEADFIGLMTPGLYQSAKELAWRAGRVMNYGDGIYGGMFVSAMYAAAFFERDPRKVVETGVAVLPPRSLYARLMRDVLAWSRQYPNDWKKVWRLIEDKWDNREACPAGALAPFNIDAKINGAYVALGLLYGHRDFGSTLEISTRAGQDSDCNPSTAGGILGVMLGYSGIPEMWKAGIPAIADKKFSFTDFTFKTICESTEKRAVALVQKTGGRLDGDTLLVKIQKPSPARLEVWNDFGVPVERIPVSDARWKFQGDWKLSGKTKIANTKGAEAVLEFTGSGVILTGPYLPSGGRADVYLDGNLVRTVDVYPDEDRPKSGEAVYHAFRIKNRRHTVRVVIRGEPFPGSTGNDVGFTDAIVFR